MHERRKPRSLEWPVLFMAQRQLCWRLHPSYYDVQWKSDLSSKNPSDDGGWRYVENASHDLPIQPISISPASRLTLQPSVQSRSGLNANVTNNGQWSLQTRSCNAVTGCTDWAVTPNTIATTVVNLQVEGSAVHVNVITGRCKYNSCSDTSLQIRFFGSNFANVRARFRLRRIFSFTGCRVSPFSLHPCTLSPCSLYPTSFPLPPWFSLISFGSC